MDSRRLFDDFSKALGQLQEALTNKSDNNVYKAGCIQYFEFTFELAWKTVKNLAEGEGLLDCNSPKAALKAAFARGWIKCEEPWLDMLAARNKMVHTYHAEDAVAVFDKLPGYCSSLKELEEVLKKAI